MNEYKKLIKNIVNKYGEDIQIDVAIEEMAELTKALIKYRGSLLNNNDKEDRIEDIIEELVDVQIMIDQLKLIFVELNKGIWNDVWRSKVNRLERMMNECLL